MSATPAWLSDDTAISWTVDLGALVLDSHRRVEEAVDSLIANNLVNPDALQLGKLALEQRLELSLALLPAGSLDHVLNGAAALSTLRGHIAPTSEFYRRVTAFVRLVEDAEPAVSWAFETEPIARRLERVTTFLCSELREWEAEGCVPGYQMGRGATESGLRPR